MISMLTVAQGDAAAQSNSQASANKILLYAIACGVVAAIISLLLVQTSNLILTLVSLLVVGLGPILGYALATGRTGKSILPMVLGPIGSLLGVGVLSGILWPILVGATSRAHSLGLLILWSVVGQILGILVALFILAPTGMGQNPSWLQTGMLVGEIIWITAVSFGLSRLK